MTETRIWTWLQLCHESLANWRETRLFSSFIIPWDILVAVVTLGPFSMVSQWQMCCMWWTVTGSRTITAQSNSCSKAQTREKTPINSRPVLRPRHCPVETLLFTPVAWPRSRDWVPSAAKWGENTITPSACGSKELAPHELSIRIWKFWLEVPTTEGTTYFGDRKDHRIDSLAFTVPETAVQAAWGEKTSMILPSCVCNDQPSPINPLVQ